MAIAFLNGASDLLTIVRSVGGAGTAAQNQDWASLGVNLGTIAGKAGVYASKQWETLGEVLRKPENMIAGSPTAILDLTGLAILAVDLAGGFGTPQSGQDVPTALDKFALYANTLSQSCIPDPRDWSGDAANAYTEQVNALVNYTATMQAYDEELQALLFKQGDAVRQAHLAISITFAALTAATGVALFLYLVKPPPWGKVASMTFQVSTAIAAIGAVAGFEMRTADESFETSSLTTALAEKYLALGQEIEQKMAGSYGQIGGAQAKETSSYASDFQSISGGVSSYAAPPNVSSLAAAAGDRVSPSQKGLLDASAKQEAAAYSTTDDAPATTGDAPARTAAPATAAAAPSLPAFTPPALRRQ